MQIKHKLLYHIDRSMQGELNLKELALNDVKEKLEY